MEDMVGGFWKGKSVFVTGATGFLGGHLCELLLSNGADVTILMRDYVPKSRFYMDGIYYKVNIVSGDVTNLELVMRALNEYDVEYVFHLAAQTIVGKSNRNPLSTFDSNIKGTWNVLESCRLHKPLKKLIVASSDKAYGTQSLLPYNEDCPLQGEHPYDVSKSCADMLAQSYIKTYNLPVVVTRCANLYGPGDLNFNRIVPGTLKSIYDKTSPVIRSDGKYIRDYLYVEDAADAYLFLSENNSVGCFNISSGHVDSVINIVSSISDFVGYSGGFTILNEACNEIREQYLNPSKIIEAGWSSKWSFEKALLPTVNWYWKYLSGGKHTFS